MRADAKEVPERYDPCLTCRLHSCNGGGAHPLQHVTAGNMSLCVDEEIADVLGALWGRGIETSNSCAAWGEWYHDGRELFALIDVVHRADISAATLLLDGPLHEVTTTQWGHHSLWWRRDSRPTSGGSPD